MTTREDIELYVMDNYDGDSAALERAVTDDPALAAIVADEARFELLLRDAAAEATFCPACDDLMRAGRCDSCGAATRPAPRKRRRLHSPLVLAATSAVLAASGIGAYGLLHSSSRAPTLPPGVAEVRAPETVITATHPGFTAQFSSHGGTLRSWHLTDPRYLDDASSNGGELIPQLPGTGAFAVSFASSTYVIPSNAEWTGTKVSETEVKYTLETDQLAVEKTYVLVPEASLVRMAVKITAKLPANGIAHERLTVTSFGFQDPRAPHRSHGGAQARVWESSTLRDGTLSSTSLQSLLEAPRYERAVQWTGFEHPYVLVGFAPKPEAGIVDKRTSAQPNGVIQTDLLFPAVDLEAGSNTLTREIVGYLGPKNYDALAGADVPAGFPTGFKQGVNFGWFGFIGRPLLWLLLTFYGFVGNWGIAIILLTVLIKGATIPFTTKSMRSMKAMAALGPQMKELQAKYRTDRQRLQSETMALYKLHGINPLSGCLPLFLQMPIWLALYRMLSTAGELYRQPFIPGWIDDLTAPDPFHVLPIVLMVTMFAQARLTPQTFDPSQKMQQRFLQYGMPLMFGVMAFYFPSGLSLYIFTNACLSALHSLVIGGQTQLPQVAVRISDDRVA